ncbi:protein FRA10AC1 homolog isoform X2 [Lineus longissimus]|uniref:protein FRA10AC1 homolog isoform X2 n=1 Tax=Lineus longissimus TaxID=88925 RepID=UPI002B4CB99A
MAEQIDLVQIHNAGGYGSEFEYDSEAERKEARRKDLATNKGTVKTKVASKREFDTEYGKEEGRTHRYHNLSLNAYDRHKKLVNDYLQYYCGSREELKRDSSRDKTDLDVIRENHQFLWEDEDEPDSWEKRLAKKYYDKLFKEYCITDLSRYKENQVAMRWRIEKEVIAGKGQFTCGNKRCDEKEGLRSWEVNFAYKEDDEKKNALVKLRLCADCSYKLNYHKKRKEVLPRKRKNDGEESPEEPKKARTESSESPETEKAETSTSDQKVPETHWSGPAKVDEDKSREDEFDDYFADILL